jgi:hypothetical protein
MRKSYRIGCSQACFLSAGYSSLLNHLRHIAGLNEAHLRWHLELQVMPQDRCWWRLPCQVQRMLISVLLMPFGCHLGWTSNYH